MKKFIDAIAMALTNHNWLAAIALSLSMPDICAGSEDPNRNSNDRYPEWFNRYVGDRYRHEFPAGYAATMKEQIEGLVTFDGDTLIYLGGKDCYALRCSFLHIGTGDITAQRAREVLAKFHFGINTGHCNIVNDQIVLDVITFCNDMCNGIRAWMVDVADNRAVQARIAETLAIHEQSFTVEPGVRLRADGPR